jgi:hypothetical protein
VWLDVLKPHAFCRGDAGHGGNLIQHEVLGVGGRDVHLAAAEPDEIRKARVGADRDTVSLREPDRAPED